MRYIPTVGERNSFVFGLSRLIGTAIHAGYQALAAGVGIQDKYSLSYPSNTPLPGALDAAVSLPRIVGRFRGNPYTTSTFLRTYDEAEAKEAFDNLVALTRAALPSVAAPYGPKSGTRKREVSKTGLHLILTHSRSRFETTRTTKKTDRTSR
jgi:hypothetical protein